MELIAVLSGAGVRRDLLHAAGKAGLLGGRQTPAEVDAALDDLASLSLLTVSLDGQIMIADGLVARVVRDGLSGPRRREAARGAAPPLADRESARLDSRHRQISAAAFCLQ